MNRITKLKKKLETEQADFLLINSKNNIYYLTDFKPTTDAYLCYADGSFHLFVTNIDYQAALTQVKEIEVVKPDLDRTIEELVKSNFKKLKGKVFFEFSNLTYQRFSELFGKSNGLKFNNIDEILNEFRAIKDSKELELIKKSIEISENAVKYAFENLKSDLKEIELAADVEYFMRKKGAESFAFDTIIISGVRTSLPHAKSGENKIKPGDIVIVDLGCKFKGYCSDITRTFTVSKPDKRQMEIYQIVKEAQEKAIRAVKSGVEIDQLDLIARNYIREKGYGDFFIHSLGHGVGLDVHEIPLISFRRKGKLKKGMVITIEPGIYIPSWGGVRIEDMILVGKESFEMLTKVKKGLDTI
ncbi:MAG: M24 family metallopeptidase [Candidatus Odinarchaeia archaeon]